MRLFFIATKNIGANNDDHDCNEKKTNESTIFHILWLLISFQQYIMPFRSLSSHRQHHHHHVQKAKLRSPVYFLPPQLLCRKREIVNLFPLFGHSSKLLRNDYFSKTYCILEQNTYKK